MRKLFYLLPLAFLFSCIPQRVNVKLPPSVLETNVPEPFEGTIEIENTEIPFYYDPKGDYMEFPLTYMGFVSYENRTLCLEDYCKTFGVELWKILKHRLVGKNCPVYRTSEDYLVECDGNPAVRLFLTPTLKVRKAEICTSEGCETYTYKGRKVETDFYGKKLVFRISP